MKKLLSYIILFALLVVSSYSFTTADIPSVFISVTIEAPLEETKLTSITVAHPIAEEISLAVFDPPPARCIISLPTLPAIDSNRVIEHGRAPPVVPSV